MTTTQPSSYAAGERRLKAFRLRLLLTAAVSLSSPALADDADPVTPDAEAQIVVYGQRLEPLLAAQVAEDSLDEEEIAAYGADNVGELLQILGEELNSGEGGPVVMINGRLATGVNEISQLPTEALAKIQTLPSEVAGRLGQSPTQRVISLTLKATHQQATLLGKLGYATAGGGQSGQGEANLFRNRALNRESLVLQARLVEPLFEAQRNIVSSSGNVPFDRTGNLLSYPNPGGPIDPALATLAGVPLTLAGLPESVEWPTIAQILANGPNAPDLGFARTLVARQRSFSANGTVARYWGDTTASFNTRAEWQRSLGLNALSGSQFSLPETSPFSPFSNDVSIARFFGDPLKQQSNNFSLESGVNVGRPIGSWQLTATANWQHRISVTASDFAYDIAAYQAAVTAGTVNPFISPDPALISLRTGTSRFKGESGQAQLIVSGAVAELPAGQLRATITASGRLDRAHSRSGSAVQTRDSRYRRDEAALGFNLQIPLLANADSSFGDVTMDLSGEGRTTSKVGSLLDYGVALSWVPTGTVQFRASYKHDEVAPLAQSLADAVVVTENARVFDFLTNQSVLVRYLTGGNPDLPVASRSIISLGATWRPFVQRNLSFGLNFTDQRGRNVQAVLPPTSAAVQSAFPDRFVRDATGALVVVDSRPVAFARENFRQIHWKIDYRGILRRVSGEADGASAPGELSFSAGRTVRGNFGVDHFWTLENTRQARPGLEVVDLLAGGAAGYGGGVPRHLVRIAAGLSARGLGLQTSGSYRSSTRIRVGSLASAGDLTFAARTTMDARLFADLGTVLPGRPVLKGARVSVEVKNLFDSQQRVRDASGGTPLRYQPYLLDALGRTVEVSLRKVF